MRFQKINKLLGKIMCADFLKILLFFLIIVDLTMKSFSGVSVGL